MPRIHSTCCSASPRSGLLLSGTSPRLSFYLLCLLFQVVQLLVAVVSLTEEAQCLISCMCAFSSFVHKGANSMKLRETSIFLAFFLRFWDPLFLAIIRHCAGRPRHQTAACSGKCDCILTGMHSSIVFYRGRISKQREAFHPTKTVSKHNEKKCPTAFRLPDRCNST